MNSSSFNGGTLKTIQFIENTQCFESKKTETSTKVQIFIIRFKINLFGEVGLDLCTPSLYTYLYSENLFHYSILYFLLQPKWWLCNILCSSLYVPGLISKLLQWAEWKCGCKPKLDQAWSKTSFWWKLSWIVLPLTLRLIIIYYSLLSLPMLDFIQY